MKCSMRAGKITTLIGLAAMMVVLFTACGKTTTTVAETLKNAKVIKAEKGAIETNVEYPGKLEPNQQVVVSPKLSGKVASVLVEVGKTVKVGDILFTMDGKDLEAQMNQQKAALELSKANLKMTESATIQQQLLSSRQAVDNAQMAYDNAKDNYDKMKQLYDAEAISKNDFNNAEDAYTSAQNNLKFAQNNYSLLKEKSGPQSVVIAGAQTKQAEAGVKTLTLQLDDSKVKAPISGVVSICNIEKGELASSATQAVTIIDTSVLVTNVEVTDEMAEKLTKGQIIKINISDGVERTVDGVVDIISPSADEKTGLYTIKIKIENKDKDITPGMFARIKLPLDKSENTITIPNSAVKTENSVPYIYIVVNGIVKKIAVQTGLSNDIITEIKSGLKVGDLVITEGQTFLSDGQKVNSIY